MASTYKRKHVPPQTPVIGANLRRLRRKAAMTQEEIAAVLGVTFQQVQKYETGMNRLPIEKLYLLKHMYDVPYEYFFVGLESFLLRRL